MNPRRDRAGRVLLPETPAVLVLRRALRAWLAEYRPDGGAVAVGLSGGADSLALTGAALAEAGAVDALVVDHQLQPGSGEVAERAAAVALELGCRSARVLTVEVHGTGGMEAAARRARYEALDAARQGLPVLLGHTLDDQAETVLLGLGRGSGARSIQGMAAYDEPWGRPLLGVRRSDTRQFCADLGRTPYEDPHNVSPDFTRVRLRTEVLPLLEDVLDGKAAIALARTAEQLREDNAVLDELAANLLIRAAAAGESASGGVRGDASRSVEIGAADRSSTVLQAEGAGVEVDALSCAVLAAAPGALRRRAVRAWLLAAGVGAVTGAHLRAIDALVVAWRGQGPVALPGGERGTGLVALRAHGRLAVVRTTRERRNRRDTS